MIKTKHIDLHFLDERGQAHVLKLHLDLNDYVQRDVAAHISLGQFYEHELSLLINRVLMEGDVAFDLGGNAGYFSSLMGCLVGKSGLVVTCEPNPRLVPRIEHHRDLNQVNVDIIRKAVSYRAGRSWFQDGGITDSNGAIVQQQVSHSYEVETDTLDNIIAENYPDIRPKLIKMDIEGAEFDAMRGGSRLLQSSSLEFVVCEFNEPQLKLFGTSSPEIRRLMLTYGFDTYLFAPDGGLPRFVPPTVEIRMQAVSNVLFARTCCIGRYWPSVDFLPAIAKFAKKQ